MYSILLSEASADRYDVVLSTGEILVSNSKTPTADAARILHDRGIDGLVRVAGKVASPFYVDVARTAAYSSSRARQRHEKAGYRLVHDHFGDAR